MEYDSGDIKRKILELRSQQQPRSSGAVESLVDGGNEKHSRKTQYAHTWFLHGHSPTFLGGFFIGFGLAWLWLGLAWLWLGLGPAWAQARAQRARRSKILLPRQDSDYLDKTPTT